MKRLLLVTFLAMAMVVGMAGTAFAAGWWTEYGGGGYDFGDTAIDTWIANTSGSVPQPCPSGETCVDRQAAPVDATDGPNANLTNPNTPDGGHTHSPHGDYSTTTNKCKTCHAVHGAEVDSFRLLHNNSRTTECNWCHDAYTGRSGHRPYGEMAIRGTTVRGEHTLTATKIPDSVVNGVQTDAEGSWGTLPNRGDGGYGLNCYYCHTVHGGDRMPNGWVPEIVRRDPAGNGYTLDGNGSPIIVDNAGVSQPNPGMSASDYEKAAFCADCHNKNPSFGNDDQGNTSQPGGSRPNPASHPSRGDGLLEIYGTNNNKVSNGLTSCRSCHSATDWANIEAYEEAGTLKNGAIPLSDFPHQSTGHKLLADTYTNDNLQGVNAGSPYRPLPALDQICLGCHTQAGDGTGTWGVGISF